MGDYLIEYNPCAGRRCGTGHYTSNPFLKSLYTTRYDEGHSIFRLIGEAASRGPQ